MKILLPAILIAVLSFNLPNDTNRGSYTGAETEKDTTEFLIKEIWNNSDFKDRIPMKIFNIAMRGYYKKNVFKKGKAVIIDFSKPSTEKRLYVINLETRSLIFNTYVAHGKNTGEDYAKYFSNILQSRKSSLGFYKTGETYFGKHGYSLKLNGLEKGINDNANKRAIVLHGAAYVSRDFIKKYGRLGRSWGCPAVPVDEASEIIDSISGGYCFFIYADDPTYTKMSKF